MGNINTVVPIINERNEQPKILTVKNYIRSKISNDIFNCINN